jgi:activator of 2-hydroxyglutaryl-CoA dehydratase
MPVCIVIPNNIGVIKLTLLTDCPAPSDKTLNNPYIQRIINYFEILAGDNIHYGLGIDAGGTYTDALIIRGSDGAVVDSKKSFTTYPDLQEGIRSVLDSLNKEYLRDVNLVSVSTTLSTNSCLKVRACLWVS